MTILEFNGDTSAKKINDLEESLKVWKQNAFDMAEACNRLTHMHSQLLSERKGEISNNDTENLEDLSLKLFKDARSIMDEKGLIKIKISDLISCLSKKSNFWSTYNRGRPIKPVHLARRLVKFGIKSSDIDFGGQVCKGYWLSDFEDNVDLQREIKKTEELEKNLRSSLDKEEEFVSAKEIKELRLTQRTLDSLEGRRKSYKVFDGGGLYIQVQPNGSKYWRIKYYFGRKEKIYCLGVYPKVSLKEARGFLQEFKESLDQGVDLGYKRQVKNLEQRELMLNNELHISELKSTISQANQALQTIAQIQKKKKKLDLEKRVASIDSVDWCDRPSDDGRIKKTLSKYGLDTLEAVSLFSKEELLRCSGINSSSVECIEKTLKKHGMELFKEN